MGGLARALGVGGLAWLLTASATIGQNLPTVAVLSTGSAIAGRHDPPKGGYVLVLSADDLVAAVPAIRTVASIATQEIREHFSSDMAPPVWLQLSTRINDLLSR
jgi:L-asparaginase